MIFLAIAWILTIIFFILELIKSKSDSNKKKHIRSFQLYLIILMAMYSLIGIATKDPLGEFICNWTNICVPAYVEWIVYIGLLGFLIWKFILVDMKTNITSLQTENKGIFDRLGKVEGTIDIIRTNTDKIMEKCLNTPNCKTKKV